MGRISISLVIFLVFFFSWALCEFVWSVVKFVKANSVFKSTEKRLESIMADMCHVPQYHLFNITSLIFTSLLIATVSTATSLTASLDYGTFEGAYSAKYNISYWTKIPFAAPPVGDNRFRAPQPPLKITEGTYNSSQPYDFCPQRTVWLLTSTLKSI